MADVILTTDTTTQHILDTTGDVYFLKEGVLHSSNSVLGTLYFNGSSAISDLSAFINGTIVNFSSVGTVQSSSDASNISIVVSETGNVQAGNLLAFDLNSEEAFLVNNGEISGAEAVRMDGATAKFFNSGVVYGTYNVSATIHTVILSEIDASLTNTGLIQGRNGISVNKNAVINNSGEIITDLKAINAQLFKSSDIIETINTGNIIGGTFSYDGDDGIDNITNHGLMSGNIDTDDSNDSLINTGTISGDITLHDNDDTLINTGAITGDIFLGNDNDIFDGRGGTVTGTVSGNDGDDIYYVDNTLINLFEDVDQGTDRVFSAADVLILGENFENLTLLGGDTNGIGNSAANNILGSVGDNVIRGNDGTDTVNGGGGDDIVFGNDGGDEVRGGGGRDILRGGGEADEVRGGSGADQLFGGTGNDDLFGGNGRDMLKGGLGRDTMQGGNGADTFVFDRVNESLKSKSDVILDFTSGEDIIDLSGLSADLSFVGGAAFSGTGAEVRATVNGDGDTLIRVDADGNGSTDMKIVLDVVATIEAFDILL